MSTLWHCKYIYVLNVCLACKVCVQQLLHLVAKTHLHMFYLIYLQKSNRHKEMFQGVLTEARMKLSVTSQLTLHTPSLMTHKPSGRLHLLAGPALPSLEPDMWCASALWRTERHSSVTAKEMTVFQQRRWSFLDAAVGTTQKKWLLSTGWLMIKRDVVYFPVAP